jgi:hypothetical protein
MPPSIRVNRLEMASLYPFEKQILGLFLDGAKALVLHEARREQRSAWPRIGTDETRMGDGELLNISTQEVPFLGLGHLTSRDQRSRLYVTLAFAE